MFLHTIEYVDVNNCEFNIENKLFATKQAALDYMAETKSNVIKSISSKLESYKGLEIEEEKHLSAMDFIKFTDKETPFFDKHILLSIEELECEDGTPMFTAQDFMKEEISNIFETTTEKDPADYDNLLETLAETAMCDDHLWDDMNADLLEIMKANPDYEKLAEEYEEHCTIQGGF